jgi:hypothetical protein
MTFDPKQPRDDAGRWTHLAGLMKSNGGFTFNMSTKAEPERGYVVAIPNPGKKDWRTLPQGATTGADLQKFADDYRDFLAQPNRGIGGWSNDNDQFGERRDALDVVEVHDTLAAALEAARIAGQDAVYDLEAGEEILVPKKAKKMPKIDWNDAMHRDMIPADLSVVTPTFEGTYDLAVQDGKMAFWKQILPMKTIHYTAKDGARKVLDFTKDYLEDLARNAAVDKVGFLLADKDNRHTMDPERWRGEVAKFEVRDDGLYGKIVFPTREAAKAVLDNPDLGVSARIREGVQRSDGSTVSRGIIHVLGTLDPQVSGMSGWQTADLSTSGEDVLDLTDATYEDTKMAFDPNKPVQDYTEDDVNGFSEEELDSYLEACAADLGVSLDEFLADLDPEAPTDDTTTTTPKEPEMALSNEAQSQIDLANERAGEALRRLAKAQWETERDRYMSDGVPPHLLDLAAPVLNRPDDFVVDLSNTDEDDVNVSAIVRGLLDAHKGTVDLSAEVGHTGTFVAGSGEDPDAEMLALWDKQSR